MTKDASVGDGEPSDPVVRTPAEHYVEAERLLGRDDEARAVSPEHRANLLAKAQVHATLAATTSDVVTGARRVECE